MFELAAWVNLVTAAVGLLTWFLYVAVYTPLKARTSANTAVGAVAGALPVLMGWSAAEASFSFAGPTAGGHARGGVVFDCLPVAVSAFHGDRLDLSPTNTPRPACKC